MQQNIDINAWEYAGGVLALDTGFERDRMACAYLLEADGVAAIIETGTHTTVPKLMRLLEWRGIAPQAVAYVIVTHVHLDHAGGAGLLMQHLPNATLLVHPRGARHMIDPAKLEASVRSVYGDAIFDRTYGRLQPVAAARVREMEDGAQLMLGSRRLEFMDSPGHARHHFCIWDEATRGWFTGDTFGLSYRELDTARGPFFFPTTTPIEFDPLALRQSIGQLMERQPQLMYLTHFGRVAVAPEMAAHLLKGVDRLVAIAESHEHSRNRLADMRTDIAHWLLKSCHAHGVQLAKDQLMAVLDVDIQLNAQGLDGWLQRRAKPTG